MATPTVTVFRVILRKYSYPREYGFALSREEAQEILRDALSKCSAEGDDHAWIVETQETPATAEYLANH
jgi:hypothetical protein